MANSIVLGIYNKVTSKITPIAGYSFDAEMENQLKVVEQLTLLVQLHTESALLGAIVEEKLIRETKKLADMISTQLVSLAHEKNYDLCDWDC